MLTITAEARAKLIAAIKASSERDPVVSLVKMGALVRKDGWEKAPPVDKNSPLAPAVFARSNFSRWSLVEVDGVRICLPFYLRALRLTLTLTPRGLELVNRRGRRVW